ncbi:type II/IV secretion system protein [Candidatus Gottesmanbacteria bacterium]|nr:type II/IV secretion system protein [Candidatus Gottesmanbacteria bacterium]
MIISDEQLKSLILENNLATQIKLAEVMEFAKNSDITLADALIEKDIVSDENLGQLIANYLKLPFINLSKISIPDDVVRIIPEKIARKQKIIPFSRDEYGIKLAMTDPGNSQIQEMISKKTSEKVIPYLATERDIFNTFHVFRKELQKTYEGLFSEEITKTGSLVIDEAPIAKIVDLLVDFAYQDKASDIHIEAEERNSLVRFRIDGILHDVLFLPKNLHERVISRIKVLSKLRTDEHMAPQDGKIRMKLDEENLDIRVSILPMVDGEKAVLRLLSSRFRQFSLLDLGMQEKDLKKVTAATKKSYGMILSTGPTGSGKTTSIYSILKILNTREKNITTIEDPVEYRIKGVNQIQTNPKTNLTFASGLRSILRQDPNIVFVGEIRDSETAGIAVNAALTGHLVLSTIHTNDSATTLPRLIDMKVEPFLVASTVNVIIAQRLVRKICDLCKTSVAITAGELAKHIPSEIIKKNFGEAVEIKTYVGKGCKICHNIGYAGRIGVFEVLEVTKNIRKLITEKNDADVIARAAIQEGMTTMLDDGLQKVAKGTTTIEEVLRVTKVESS